MDDEDELTKKWKALSTDRSQAMTDGVMGIVIALAAYVLMSIAVVGWIQWWVLLGTFALVCWLAFFVWDISANALAIAPHDSRLLILAVVQVLLLIPLAFSARLVLDSQAKEAAATLLVITTGGVFGLTGLISTLALRTPEASAVPHWAVADQRAAPIGAMAGLLVALLWLLVPAEATIPAMPWQASRRGPSASDAVSARSSWGWWWPAFSSASACQSPPVTPPRCRGSARRFPRKR